MESEKWSLIGSVLNLGVSHKQNLLVSNSTQQREVGERGLPEQISSSSGGSFSWAEARRAGNLSFLFEDCIQPLLLAVLGELTICDAGKLLVTYIMSLCPVYTGLVDIMTLEKKLCKRN